MQSQESKQSKQSESPSCANLSSLSHDDIIDCLIQSIKEKNYWQQNPDQGVKLDFDQKEWLKDVNNNCGDESVTVAVDVNNPQKVCFALLNLAQAGQKLNAIKFME